MGKKLVIVESPAKARTINKILGKDFLVKASMGHVRDLPEKQLGVDIEKNFTPQYKVIKDKQKVIKELQNAAKDVETVYLAPDPDREGEAIAWHLQAALEKQVPAENFLRVTYNEITAPAIREAFAHPRQIDQNRVNSQQARRILDRIVGYKVSPLLWSRVRGGASAGRVQSVALRLVCEREKEIRNFVKEKFWVLGAKLRKLVDPRDVFETRLVKIGNEKADLRDEAQAERIFEDVQNSAFRVQSIKDKETQKRARPPYITSSLQQAGSSVHGFSPSRTMMIAQKLYEGVDLGEGRIGLITYMRTDSFNVSKVAQDQARDFIRKNFGDDYVPEKPNFYKSRGTAQEAHEAIRPTDPSRTPESVQSALSPEEAKLYALIWKRFMASQMTPARIAQRSVEIEALPKREGADPLLFRANASQVLFPGYMKASGLEKTKTQNEGEEEEDDTQGSLPPLTEGEGLECVEPVRAEKETQPPPRYTEASLIRALEENGVGRPSTYAAILSTLNARKYIAREKKAILPTELGDRVCDFLVAHLSELFDVQFTAAMEKKLDDIESGEVEWHQMLGEFYQNFLGWVQQAKGPSADPGHVGQVLGMLSQVREWAPARQAGKREYSDEKFVESVRQQFEAGEKAVSQRQADALLKLGVKYKDQISGWDEFVAAQGLGEAIGAIEAKNLPPREETSGKLDALADVAFKDARTIGKKTYDDRVFYESLKKQNDEGRRFSDRQVAALDKMLLKYADQIGGREQVVAQFGLVEQEKKPGEDSGPILALMESVQAWREPVKRGRREWDDHAFYQSLKAQYAQKHELSFKQHMALKKMVVRYRDQIPSFAEEAEKQGLVIPQKKASKGKNLEERAE